MNKPVYLGLPILELSRILMYEFWYDYVKPQYGKKQNCVIWIQTASCIHKNMIFIKILQKIFKLDMIPQIMNQTSHYKKPKIKK